MSTDARKGPSADELNDFIEQWRMLHALSDERPIEYDRMMLHYALKKWGAPAPKVEASEETDYERVKRERPDLMAEAEAELDESESRFAPPAPYYPAECVSQKNGPIMVRTCIECGEEYADFTCISSMKCPLCRRPAPYDDKLVEALIEAADEAADVLRTNGFPFAGGTLSDAVFNLRASRPVERAGILEAAESLQAAACDPDALARIVLEHRASRPVERRVEVEGVAHLRPNGEIFAVTIGGTREENEQRCAEFNGPNSKRVDPCTITLHAAAREEG